MLDNIDEILNSEYKQKQKDGCYLLKEKKRNLQTKLKTSGKLILFKFDDDKKLFPFFNKDVEYLNSMCDYIAFQEYKEKIVVILIELTDKKSKTFQLKSAQIFSEFIIHSCERVKRQKIEFEFLKILVKEKNIAKITTKPNSIEVFEHKASSDLNLTNYLNYARS